MNKFFNFAANVQKVFNDDATDFLAFSELLTETALGAQKVEKKEADAKIVEVFRGALGLGEHPTQKEVRQALRRNQALVFDIIEETVQSLLVSGWGNDPFFMKYVDQRNLALGDKNEFITEDDSIMSVMRVAGNHHDIIRQRLGAGESMSVTTYWCAIKTYSEFERVLTGAEDFATYVNKMYEAYDLYIKNTIFDTMVGYANAIPATWKRTGSLTDVGLREFCQLISTATGMPVRIMGTRAALANVTALQNASFISNEMKNEHYRTGTLGMWEGIELVEIPQVFVRKQIGTYALDNSLLWIMPASEEKWIKLVNEGDTQLRTINDKDTLMDMTYEQEMQTKLGVSIMMNSTFGVWDIDAA